MDSKKMKEAIEGLGDLPGSLKKRYTCPTCFGSDTASLRVYLAQARPKGRWGIGLLIGSNLLGWIVYFGVELFHPGHNEGVMAALGMALLVGLVGIAAVYFTSPSRSVDNIPGVGRGFVSRAWICRRDLTIWEPDEQEPTNPGVSSPDKKISGDKIVPFRSDLRASGDSGGG